jgi:uncharacterized radical SAM superfamily protein
MAESASRQIALLKLEHIGWRARPGAVTVVDETHYLCRHALQRFQDEVVIIVGCIQPHFASRVSLDQVAFILGGDQLLPNPLLR